MQSKQRVLDSRISFSGFTRFFLAISGWLLIAPCYASHGTIAQKWLDGCSTLEAQNSLSSLKVAAPDKYGKWNPLRFIFGNKGLIDPMIACDLGAVYEEIGDFSSGFSTYVSAIESKKAEEITEIRLLLGAMRCALKIEKEKEAEKYNKIYLNKCSHLPTVLFSDRFAIMIPKSFCGSSLKKELSTFEKHVNSFSSLKKGITIDHVVTTLGVVITKTDQLTIQEMQKSDIWGKGEYPFQCIKLSSPGHKMHWLSVMRKAMYLLQEEDFRGAISCIEKAQKKFQEFRKEEMILLPEKENQALFALGAILMFEQFQSYFSRQYGDCGEFALLESLQFLKESGHIGKSIKKNVLKSMFAIPGPGAFQILHKIASEGSFETKNDISVGSVDGLVYLESLNTCWTNFLYELLRECETQSETCSFFHGLQSCVRTPSGALLFPQITHEEDLKKVFSLILCAFMEQYQNPNYEDKTARKEILGIFSTDLLVPIIEIGYSGL